MRAVTAASANPSAQAGKRRCLASSNPPLPRPSAGSQSSRYEKSRISKIDVKITGDEAPTRENEVAATSIQVLRLTAAKMPSGIETSNERTKLAVANFTVTGKRSTISVPTL